MLKRRYPFLPSLVLSLVFSLSMNISSEEMEMSHSHMKGHEMHKASHHAPSGIMGW